MLDTFLGWSVALAFLLALCTPVLIALYGTRGAKWSMLAIAALCAASFWLSWTTDIQDEVLTGNSNALGILMSIAVFVFASVVVAISLTVRNFFGTRKPMTGEQEGFDAHRGPQG